MTADPLDLCRRCEAILAELGASEHCTAIEARRHEGHQADLRLIFDDRGWLQSDGGDKLLSVLEEQPSIESAKRRKSTIHIRFEDEALVDLERRLGTGEPAGMRPGNAFAGQRVTVSYLGPNTNKALHVGHLRNVIVGEALSSAYAAAGVTVRRHNLVGDIGRRVCEAMGGYVKSHAGESPADGGIPGDRFVEYCCRDYYGDIGESGAGAEMRKMLGDPNAEERTKIGDLADTLMEEWLAGSEEERELWGRMRGWVLDGHERTLARMGISIDHCDFESENLDRATALLEQGVADGIVEREESGAVVYRSERSEYPTMVLIREDGCPTEHARLLGTYDRILDELEPGEPYVEVAGYEWQPPVTVLCEVHERLRPGARNETHQRLYHAAVTWAGGEKIGSSTGDVLWIDDFLDEVAAAPAVGVLEQISGGTVPRAEIADLLIRGTFLGAPTSRSLPFSREALTESQPGPGWTIAEAWCRAQRGEAAGEATEPIARTTVLQSQQYWRALRRTVEKRDVTTLSRYLVGLSEVSMDCEEPGPAAAPVLKRVLGSLGFVAGRSERPLARPDGAVAVQEVGTV